MTKLIYVVMKISYTPSDFGFDEYRHPIQAFMDEQEANEFVSRKNEARTTDWDASYEVESVELVDNS